MLKLKKEWLSLLGRIALQGRNNRTSAQGNGTSWNITRAINDTGTAALRKEPAHSKSLVPISTAKNAPNDTISTIAKEIGSVPPNPNPPPVTQNMSEPS